MLRHQQSTRYGFNILRRHLHALSPELCENMPSPTTLILIPSQLENSRILSACAQHQHPPLHQPLAVADPLQKSNKHLSTHSNLLIIECYTTHLLVSCFKNSTYRRHYSQRIKLNPSPNLTGYPYLSADTGILSYIIPCATPARPSPSIVCTSFCV